MSVISGEGWVFCSCLFCGFVEKMLWSGGSSGCSIFRGARWSVWIGAGEVAGF